MPSDQILASDTLSMVEKEDFCTFSKVKNAESSEQKRNNFMMLFDTEKGIYSNNTRNKNSSK